MPQHESPSDAANESQELAEVIDPCSAGNGTNLSLVDMGLVDGVEIDERHVTVDIRLTTPACTMAPYFVDEIEAQVGELDGVTSVSVTFDEGYTWLPSMMTDEARERRRKVLFERDRQACADEDLAASLDEAFTPPSG
jgi:metal-sulfur cluster biosynthetic enzyme